MQLRIMRLDPVIIFYSARNISVYAMPVEVIMVVEVLRNLRNHTQTLVHIFYCAADKLKSQHHNNILFHSAACTVRRQTR